MAVDEVPGITRVAGRLQKLTVKSLYKRGSGYSFNVDGQAMWFCTGNRSWGLRDPFLAEGDRVELAVLNAPLLTDGEQRVYALHNCEDDSVYVAHFVWQGNSAPYAATRIPPGREHRYALTLAAFLVVVFGVGCGMGLTTKAGGSFWVWPGATCLGTWLLVAVALYVMRWRWRAGLPTRRQRVLDAVYRCLDLGSPLEPSKRIQSV